MWEDDLQGAPNTPLNVTCTSSDCNNDLHCFKANRTLKATNRIGACRDCGIDLIDWKRVHQKDIADVHYTFEALKREMIRHHYWHVPINQRAVNHALRKGSFLLRDFTRKQLQKLIGSAQNFWEGRQTPKYDSDRATNVVYFAQHATATCCRACLEYWHQIPTGRDLTDQELEYLTSLAMLYIEDRVPELTEGPQSISVYSQKTKV